MRSDATGGNRGGGSHLHQQSRRRQQQSQEDGYYGPDSFTVTTDSHDIHADHGQQDPYRPHEHKWSRISTNSESLSVPTGNISVYGPGGDDLSDSELRSRRNRKKITGDGSRCGSRTLADWLCGKVSAVDGGFTQTFHRTHPFVNVLLRFSFS